MLMIHKSLCRYVHSVDKTRKKKYSCDIRIHFSSVHKYSKRTPSTPELAAKVRDICNTETGCSVTGGTLCASSENENEPYLHRKQLLLASLFRRLLALFRVGSAIIPELHIAIHVSLLQFSAVFLENIFQCALIIHKDAQVVADHMAVGTRRATDQDRTTMVAMLGHLVGRSAAAWLAGKCDLIHRLLSPACSVLLGIFCILGVGGSTVGERARIASFGLFRRCE